MKDKPIKAMPEEIKKYLLNISDSIPMYNEWLKDDINNNRCLIPLVRIFIGIGLSIDLHTDNKFVELRDKFTKDS